MRARRARPSRVRAGRARRSADPPAFPASFRAEVEQRVTRAEGKTNVRPTLDDDADVGEFPDEATEPVLATVYHERRMQAERVDVHAPAPVSFLFLFSRGVAYQLTDEACHTAPIHHAMTNARLAQAATFLGKVNITRVAAFDDDVSDARSDSGSDSDADSDADARPSDSPSPSSGRASSATVSAERWSNVVPGYDASEEVFVVRDPDGGRFSKPVRDTFRRARSRRRHRRRDGVPRVDAATVRPRVVPPAAGVRGVRAESLGNARARRRAKEHPAF